MVDQTIKLKLECIAKQKKMIQHKKRQNFIRQNKILK